MSGPTRSKDRLRPCRARGQSFLRDPGFTRRIVSAIAVGPEDIFLEIGAGSGELTLPLAAEGARRIVAVEAEPILAAQLNRALHKRGVERVEVIEMDFLDLDVPRTLRERGFETVRVVGNLPYSVASPILRKLLSVRTHLTDLTLMFQQEVAQRLVAQPGTRAYGYLSVIAQQAAQIEIALLVPPQAFWPRPKVNSALVKMRLRREKEPEVREAKVFHALVKALLAHRRKNISNNIRYLKSPFLEASVVRDGLDRLNIDPSRRAETLSVEEFAALSHFCSSRR